MKLQSSLRRALRPVLLLVTLLTLATTACPAFAQVTGRCGQYIEPKKQHATIIVFVNGIFNDDSGACNSSMALARVIGASAFSALEMTYVPDGYDYTYYHNPNNALGDVNELRAQAALSDVALGIANVGDPASMSAAQKASYQDALASLYVGLAGTSDPAMSRVYKSALQLKNVIKRYLASHRRVIAVAHSQGNFYIEAAHALLRAEAAAGLDALRVVGVASVAATTPNDLYISNAGDNAVYRAQALNTSWLSLYGTARYRPLPPTTSLRFLGAKTGAFHSFTDVYLSDEFYSPELGNQSYRLIVRDLVRSVFLADAPVAPAAPPAVSSLNFQNTPVPRLVVTFGVDMAPGYFTTGAYVPVPGREGIWTDPRTFTIEFTSYVPGGTITLKASGFKSAASAGGLLMAADVVFKFPD